MLQCDQYDQECKRVTYLVGQIWQCVKIVQCAGMAAGLCALCGVEMAQEMDE